MSAFSYVTMEVELQQTKTQIVENFAWQLFYNEHFFLSLTLASVSPLAARVHVSTKI